MSKHNLSGKVVWITGASSGIGEALAHAYAQQGAKLLLSARREDELARVAAACGGAEILPLDLAETSSLESKVADARARMGHIDVMVHNGGISQRSRAIDTSLDVDERLMRVNYFGAVAITKALLPWMVARKSGQFVVISSLVGVFGTPLRSSYAASKHALHGFFDSLRAEHESDQIRVTIACPGFVKTNISKNALTGDGSLLGSMDRATGKGMDAADCAKRIVRAAEDGQAEVYVGGREVAGIYAHRFSPSLFARLIGRVKVT